MSTTHIPQDYDALMEAFQRDIEEKGLDAGREHFRKAQAKALAVGQGSRNAGASLAINGSLQEVAGAIREMLMSAPPAARASLKFAQVLGAETCAMLALRSCFNDLGEKTTKVLSGLSRALRTELHAAAVKAGAPGLYYFMLDELKKNSSGRHKSKVMSTVRKLAEVDDDKAAGLTPEVLLNLAQKLFGCVLETTGLFYTEEGLENGRKGQSLYYVLRATPQAVGFMKAMDARAECMRPVHPVMVCPPQPWKGLETEDGVSLTGGYLTAHQRLEFLKGAPTAYLGDALGQGLLGSTFSALNFLQGSALRVHSKVLAVALEAWDKDLAIGVMPQQAPVAVPPSPAAKLGIDPQEYKKLHPAEWKTWCKGASKIHAWNGSGERESKIHDTQQALSIAQDYAGFPALYFPHQLDFRGRMYPATNFLSLQGNDLQKGLLEFSEGVPMTAKGARNLAIVGATLWANEGLDKQPLSVREQWVLDNEGIILRCARQPLECLWWAEADGGATAWSFLAFCFEYARWKEQGEGWPSRFIGFSDGKCNGSQHHAALLRAEREAGYVCMTPSELPDDLYTRVLDVVRERIERDAVEGATVLWGAKDGEEDEDGELPEGSITVGLLARALQGKVKRAHVKRACMTYSYGVTMLGVRDQLKADHRVFFERFEKAQRKPIIAYLADITMDAVRQVVKASAECMRFLQDVARVAAKADLPVLWHTPDGFPVLQRYEKYDVVRVRTSVSGGLRVKVDHTNRVRGTFLGETGKICRALITDKAAAAQVLSELEEMLSYGVFKTLNATYRSALAAGEGLEAFEELAAGTLEDVLVGDLGKLKDGLLEILLRVLAEQYDTTTEEGGSVRVSMRKPSGKLDTLKQASAMAPNFIHSLDACHLRMTINACVAEGFPAFAAVHDSFGCHIELWDDMNRVLRAQFVEMYERCDPLQMLLDSVAAMVGEKEAKKLPKLPARGTLDIRKVLESAYFFA